MTDIAITHRFAHGLSWAPAGPSILECRAHALVDADGHVWLVDPFDGPGLAAELDALGSVAGVIVLLDRHLRDASVLARRYDVPLLVPPGELRRGHPRPEGARTEVAHGAACPFQLLPIVRRDGSWLEQVLWWPEERVLIVAEALGTAPAYLARPDAELGVHPLLRTGGVPPRLAELDVEPDLLLLGHGEPLDHSVRSSMTTATEAARKDLPRLLLRTPKLVTSWLRGARGGTRMSC